MKQQKPKRGAELFERDPRTGEKTDARIWDAMLNGDTVPGFDGMDPEALKRRLKEYGEPSEPEPAGPRDRAETPYVLFLRTTSHGQQPAGRAVLRGDLVVFEGVEPHVVEEMEHGIRVGRRTFTPADGDAFLRALPVQYSGSYFRAAYRGRRSR